ncbi:MAG: hypothetical protein CL779_00910 [Chloroflexi bacterium]|nr:hypothetical protein [Chloroflexota bacterium]|tara:strand:+ start:1723 stop:2574 length:852 start_codon:yes stop_codon:yes gene_type:complete
MIIDAHTHLFSDEQINKRDLLIRNDENFNSIYSSPDAKMANVEDLLESMYQAKIDMSIIMGFQWKEKSHYDSHAKYLISQQQNYPDKLISFVPLYINNFNEIKMKIEDMHKAGVKGFGEIRIDNEIKEKTLLDKILPELFHVINMFDMKINFHTSEPVGHYYPGKENGLTLSSIWKIINSFDFDIIASHFGAGIPIYQFMPFVKKKIQESKMHFDTAAFSLLYDSRILELAIESFGSKKFFWGSDFPLINQSTDLILMNKLNITQKSRNDLLGNNLIHYLNLS